MNIKGYLRYVSVQAYHLQGERYQVVTLVLSRNVQLPFVLNLHQ